MGSGTSVDCRFGYGTGGGLGSGTRERGGCLGQETSTLHKFIVLGQSGFVQQAVKYLTGLSVAAQGHFGTEESHLSGVSLLT